jgi:D-sedoheptulose 7-phosphate isomerase
VSDIQALYPFLGGPENRADDAAEQATRSTREKIAEAAQLRGRCLADYAAALAECAERLAARFRAGGRLFAFGNGGSATDAQSLASAFLAPWEGPPLPALTLAGDVAVLTALANDVSIDVVFARQVAALTRPGDIAVGLSTSGNSTNVLAGLAEAARRGLLTVGFAGGDGGRMAHAPELDFCFVVPSPSVHRIQEAQTTLYHTLRRLCAAALDRPVGREA